MAYKDDDLSWDISIGAELGRSQSSHSNLNGLGNIGMTATINTDVNYFMGPLNSYLVLENHLDGSKGNIASVGLDLMLPLGLLTGSLNLNDMKEMDGPPDGIALMFSLAGHFGDKNYNQAYWGINEKQSNNSIYDEYHLEAGFHSWNVSIGAMVPLTQRWGMILNLEYYRLSGSAANSPINNTKDGTSMGAIFRYEF
jgi:outer membrane scaffolding protein for murein synthesis (MipA/OmpV family)